MYVKSLSKGENIVESNYPPMFFFFLVGDVELEEFYVINMYDIKKMKWIKPVRLILLYRRHAKTGLGARKTHHNIIGPVT